MTFSNGPLKKLAALPEATFKEAESYFQELLGKWGLPKELVWVFGEDLLSTSRGLVIRKTDPRKAREIAKAVFEFGKRRNLGLDMHAFAIHNTTVYAYIALPEDEVDAQYLLMDRHAVKFSIRTRLDKVTFIRSLLVWAIKKLLARDNYDFLLGLRIAFRKSVRSTVWAREGAFRT